MADSLNSKVLSRLAKSYGHSRNKECLYCPLLAAAIAAKKETTIRLLMATALKEKVRVKAIEEIIFQSHLFLGYPAMIEAARTFSEFRPERQMKNARLKAYSGVACQNWHEKGLEKIDLIYGPVLQKLIEYMNSFSPQILTWMINNAYGQVLSRPGISFRLRELSTVSTLTITSYENQLKAHIRGAFNLGIEPDLIKKTIENCRFLCSDRKVQLSLKIFERFRQLHA